ncbi:calcium/proton exchanger [Clostridium massiliamazoniense]|uniref:calcium/proton exchanger n=1 Tax=Clostridium massiliamazoniense TaxID=1347366 RepID=UPI0006D7C3F3|nr:calcium/proton exchanger [Clostridium massiliamazoniense]
MKILKYLLIFIPISFIGEFLKISPSINFIFAALSIIPLAGLMGEATEEISFYTGPKVGGFLNSTFGNATELIISFFALKAGLFDVVKASIVGSVIGNILLVLGASMFAGGLKFKTQKFNKKIVEVSSSMLLFAVIGLSIPAVFTHTLDKSLINTRYEDFSIFVAAVMFIIYILSLVFSFFTHKNVYETTEEENNSSLNTNEEESEDKNKWSLGKAIAVLAISTICIAIESEFLVNGVDAITSTLGLSDLFVGIILIPIIGNAAEHSTAVSMALKNKMDVSVEIAIGSSLQIILFVTPVLIFLSLFFKPMSIVFNTFELVSMFLAVLIVNRIASDGESHWLEGFQLLAVYLIIAAGFFIV